ncbi:MAG: TIR domain-containing protein [Hyphomicrobiaceae bacterium]
MRIFLSYSRKDAAFTQWLAEALSRRGYTVDYDQAGADPTNVQLGIAAEDEWWQRLKAMIAAADTVVFVVSPDSAKSPVCDEEIAYARGLGRRVIPVLVRAIDFARAPPRLAALNVKISFADADDQVISAALERLCAALDIDITWHREATRLTALALVWADRGRLQDQLLSPADIRAVDQLFAARPQSADAPPSLLIELRDESRKRQDEDMRRFRRTTGRAFVRPAEEALRRGNAELALRLAAAGAVLAHDLDFGQIPELWGLAARAIAAHGRTLAVMRGHVGPVDEVIADGAGERALTRSADGTMRLWNVVKAVEIGQWSAVARVPGQAVFSASGGKLAIAAGNDWVLIVDAADGSTRCELGPIGETGLPVAFQPDGDRLLLRVGVHRIETWSIKDNRALAAFDGAPSTLTAAKLAPDGARVAIAAKDGLVQLLDGCTLAPIAELPAHKSQVHTLSFSNDGARLLTSALEPVVRVWDTRAGEPVASLECSPGNITHAVLSPDGRTAVMAPDSMFGVTGTPHEAQLWSVDDARQTGVLRGHSLPLSGLCFTSDGTRLLSTSFDATAQVCDGSGNVLAGLVGHDHWISSGVFVSGGTRVITSSRDGMARVFDAGSSGSFARLDHSRQAVVQSTFTSDGLSLLTLCKDGSVHVSPVDGEHLAQRLSGIDTPVRRVAMSPREARAVVLTATPTAFLCDVVTRTIMARLDGHGVPFASVAFNPAGTRLTAIAIDQTLRVWSGADGSLIDTVAGNGSEVAAAAVCHQSGRVACASIDGTIAVFEPDNCANQICIRVDAVPRELAFSPMGKMLLVRTADRSLQIVGLAAGTAAQPTKLPSSIRSYAISPDDRTLALALDDHSVRLWDIATASEVRELRGHVQSLSAVAFSPDGQLLASAGGFRGSTVDNSDNVVRLWHVATGELTGVLSGHTMPINHVAFTSDGCTLATASEDGSARLWDISRTALACRDPAIALTSVLALGVGMLSTTEGNDLMLREAPHDLFAAASQLLLDRRSYSAEEIARRERVLADTIVTLRAPLRRGCYSASGIQMPPAAGAAGSVAEKQPITRRTPVDETALATQVYVETINHHHIFRLTDGRYHVVEHFAVPTLEEARAIALAARVALPGVSTSTAIGQASPRGSRP